MEIVRVLFSICSTMFVYDSAGVSSLHGLICVPVCRALVMPFVCACAKDVGYCVCERCWRCCRRDWINPGIVAKRDASVESHIRGYIVAAFLRIWGCFSVAPRLASACVKRTFIL